MQSISNLCKYTYKQLYILKYNILYGQIKYHVHDRIIIFELDSFNN